MVEWCYIVLSWGIQCQKAQHRWHRLKQYVSIPGIIKSNKINMKIQVIDQNNIQPNIYVPGGIFFPRTNILFMLYSMTGGPLGTRSLKIFVGSKTAILTIIRILSRIPKWSLISKHWWVARWWAFIQRLGVFVTYVFTNIT